MLTRSLPRRRSQIAERAKARIPGEDAAAQESANKRAAEGALSGWSGGFSRRSKRGAAKKKDPGVAPSRDLARHCTAAGASLTRCVQLLRGEGSGGGLGIALLDEVDSLMHPLRSEVRAWRLGAEVASLSNAPSPPPLQLNYPSGPKEDLPLAPTRWNLPLVLLEAVLVGHALSSGRRRSDAVVVRALGESNTAVVLARVAAAFQRGRARFAFSDVPHLQVRQVAAPAASLRTHAVSPHSHPQIVNAAWFSEDLAPAVAAAAFAWCCVPHADEPDLGAAMRTLAAAAASGVLGGSDSQAAPLSAAGPAFVAFVATPPAETAQSRAFAAAATAVSELPPRCRQVLVYARLWCVQYLPHVLRKTNRVGYGLLDISVAPGASGRSRAPRFGGGGGASPAESLKADPRVPLARRMVRSLAAA